MISNEQEEETEQYYKNVIFIFFIFGILAFLLFVIVISLRIRKCIIICMYQKKFSLQKSKKKHIKLQKISLPESITTNRNS